MDISIQPASTGLTLHPKESPVFSALRGFFLYSEPNGGA
jgi:hypothetical protein